MCDRLSRLKRRSVFQSVDYDVRPPLNRFSLQLPVLSSHIFYCYGVVISFDAHRGIELQQKKGEFAGEVSCFYLRYLQLSLNPS